LYEKPKLKTNPYPERVYDYGKYDQAPLNAEKLAQLSKDDKFLQWWARSWVGNTFRKDPKKFVWSVTFGALLFMFSPAILTQWISPLNQTKNFAIEALFPPKFDDPEDSEE